MSRWTATGLRSASPGGRPLLVFLRSIAIFRIRPFVHRNRSLSTSRKAGHALEQPERTTSESPLDRPLRHAPCSTSSTFLRRPTGRQSCEGSARCSGGLEPNAPTWTSVAASQEADVDADARCRCSMPMPMPMPMPMLDVDVDADADARCRCRCRCRCSMLDARCRCSMPMSMLDADIARTSWV